MSGLEEAVRRLPELARAALAFLEDDGFRFTERDGGLRWASAGVSLAMWIDEYEYSLASDLRRGRDGERVMLDELAAVVDFDLRIGVGAAVSVAVLERALERVAALLRGPGASALAGEPELFERVDELRRAFTAGVVDGPIRRDVEEAWRSGDLARAADRLAALERPTPSELAKLRYALRRLLQE